MIMNQRFLLNENGYIIDTLNPANNNKAEWNDQLGYKIHENCFRELLLWQRLGELLPKLMDPSPIQKRLTVMTFRPVREGSTSIWVVLYRAIKASHLNSLDIALSVQHKFDGVLKREKKGTQAITSLSLFVEDIERLLRDLYGDIDSEALDKILYSAFTHC